MKKSCLIAVIATLAAVAGALAAVAVYLHRREKELDEYERLLFGEDKAIIPGKAKNYNPNCRNFINPGNHSNLVSSSFL